MLRYIKAILLAGGMSKRFEINKCYLQIKNISFITYKYILLLKIGFFCPLLAANIKILIV